MKEALERLLINVAELLKVKTLMTLTLTVGMMCLLSGVWTPQAEIIALYSTAFGSVITYFFTRKDN